MGPGAGAGAGDSGGSGGAVTLCIENTVGSGAHLGGPWEHLRDMREAIVALAPRGSASRVGFCIDTCHAHAFGHDMSTEAGARAALDALDKVAGLEHVKVLHLNDSKGACGSRLDRHEHVGEGTIGLEGFRAVVNHPALARIPKILETPKEDTPKGTPWDTVNLRRLRRMIRDEPASSGDAAPVTPRRGRRAAAGR
ncbi:MAG: deoxyribonuclease IV [Phycisphaerales bacterium]|nr:MAG: deoxyribonuclease IV [Phycisphaerales bacterium]